jgi:ribonucleoside-diphosphate reductase alpha chain
MRVKKRNGNLEDFDINKIKKVIKWATDGIDVNPLELESQMSIIFKDGMTTDEIHENSIIAANNLTSIENPEMRYVAGRLYIMQFWKHLKISRGYIYSLYRTVTENCSKGIYDKKILDMYTEEEWKELNNYMERERDLIYDMTGAHTLVKRYLLGNENIQEMYMVICAILADGNVEKAKVFYDEVSLGRISLATPILLNLRKPNGSLTSCFILDMDDGLSEIFDTIKEFAMISKNAGAAGVDLSKIRSTGSSIRGVDGVAGGVIPIVKILNDVAIYVDQQGKRAGSVTPALPVWHLDFYDYLETQTETGDQRKKAHDVFLQAIISDVFMERMIDDKNFIMFDPYEVSKVTGKNPSTLTGDEFKNLYEEVKELAENGKLTTYKIERARDIFKKIIATAMIKGIPYWSFKDTINKYNPAKKIGHIPHGNLCVTGRTKILTKNGYTPIRDLDGQTVEVWDGKEFVKAPIYKTSKEGEKQEIRRVILSSGKEVETTLYHRWYVLDTSKGQHSERDLQKLLDADALIVKETKDLVQGDVIILPELPAIDGTEEIDFAHEKGTLYSRKEDFIPIGDYTLNTKCRFLRGAMTGNRAYTEGKNAGEVTFSYQNKATALKLQLLLQEIGVNSKTSITSTEHNDFRVIVSDTSFEEFFNKIGDDLKKDFTPKMIKSIESQYVVAVIDDSIQAETYCGTSPKRETLMFNGILTMNCMESFSVTTEEYAHSCNLVSGVSPRLETGEDFKRAITVALEIINRVIDITSSPIKRAQKHNEDFRVAGIGFLGFADWMAKNKLSYDSSTDLKEVSNYYERAALYALEASIEEAKKNGKFPRYDDSEWAEGKLYGKSLEEILKDASYPEEWKILYEAQKKHGVANLQMFAIAPNSSTGLVQGVTPSILPPWDIMYIDSSSLGNLIKMPMYVKDSLWYYKAYKNYDRKAMNSFIQTVQKWIDSGISYEVVFDLNKDSMADIADFYIDAWKKDIKTVYYIRWIQPSGEVQEKDESCTLCAN